jgi:hypothetical protein
MARQDALALTPLSIPMSKLAPLSSSVCYLGMAIRAVSLLTLCRREEGIKATAAYLYLVDELGYRARHGYTRSRNSTEKHSLFVA